MRALNKREILVLFAALFAGITLVMIISVPHGETHPPAMHPPIKLYRNEILDAFPGKSGTGTQEDPYVIENLVIDSRINGIDLENIGSGSPYLIKYFFTKKEADAIFSEATLNGHLDACITKYWTRKEAVAKYLKLGMKLNFASLDTTSDYLSIKEISNQFIRLTSYNFEDYYLSVAT